MSQWNLLTLSDSQMRVGSQIIENLDENGYLIDSLAEIAENSGVDVPQVQNTLTLVQSLDPPGVGCRNLGECVVLQMRRLGLQDKRLEELVKSIVENHLQDIQAGKLSRAAKKLNITVSGIQTAVEIMRRLNPKPGRAFGAFRPFYVVPDIVFRRKHGGYEVLCSRRDLPELKVHASYKKLLRDPHTSPDVRQYLKDKLNSALALLRALEKRESTLERMAACLARVQADFLSKGVAYLKPLRMTQLARRLGVHKSTVCRAVADKYAETPRGVVALRAFFDNAVGAEGKKHSSSTVKDKIRLLIKKESLRRPASDHEIVVLLKRQGISVARRTVAKYRQALHLPPAYSRKS
jgi:RNA polymerase sigma-54 factor